MSTAHSIQLACGLYLVWMVGAGASLLLQRRTPVATLAWLFAFAALPLVSGVYYVVFGPRRLTRRKVRYDRTRRALATGVTSYLRASHSPLVPLLSPDAAALAAVGMRLLQGSPTYATGVTLLVDGDDCLDALEAAIADAKHHVHCEYYIWDPDSVGMRIRDALIGAARRRVDVRVVTDALGSSAGPAFWAPLQAAGGRVRVFNPVRFSLRSLGLANFRTHRKIVVCDGDVGFCGGNNLHDPVSERIAGLAAWRDLHLRIAGEPVRRLQRLFLENWLYAGGSFQLTAESVSRYFPPAVAPPGVTPGIPVQILASGPDDPRSTIHHFFLAAIAMARTRVWIETPYLVPDESLESALRVAVLRGVDVRVIVPRSGDSRIVNAASRTYCETLSAEGIGIFDYGPPMLHAKTMVVDDAVAVVGTANMDNRSFHLNFEVIAAVYDAATIEALARRFEQDLAGSTPFRGRGRGERLTLLFESIARLFSPIL